MKLCLWLLLILIFEATMTLADTNSFPVVEFRRYTIKEKEREDFALYFETYFPEAFQQIGSMIFGHFYERNNPSGFTWIRGFENMEERAALNSAFYSGPLWKEHSAKMNDRLLDHTNVLLLKPVRPGNGIPVLPAVDPLKEERGARGIVMAQIFTIRPGSVDDFAEKTEAEFSRYRTAGIREAGILVTLDVPNNFPRLPFRTDGPYLLWLGIVKDDQQLEENATPLLKQGAEKLFATGLLRKEPELLILDPAPRSRLRWVPDSLR
jgi:hypothetical protein